LDVKRVDSKDGEDENGDGVVDADAFDNDPRVEGGGKVM